MVGDIVVFGSHGDVGFTIKWLLGSGTNVISVAFYGY
jgi:hypothetical protein